MAMDNVREGNAMAAAVAAISIPQTSPISGATLQQIWQGIAGANIAELSGHAEVAPGTFAVSSAPGPVTGDGGPVS